MITIDKKLISDLLAGAACNPRKRQNYDLRTSPAENSQRMLNALLPGTEVPVHRHPNSNESVICLTGKLEEVLYEDDRIEGFERGMDAQDVPSGYRLKEVGRCLLDPSAGSFGCIIPAGAWHTVEVLEPSVIMEVKDGRYGEDGSETMEKVMKNPR